MVNSTTSVLEHMIDDLLEESSILIEDSIQVKDILSNNQHIEKGGDASMDSIQLSGECSIYEITQLHQQIHDNWQANSSLSLEVSQVTEVDAAFVQLLASCKKQAGENDQAFELIKPSEPLLQKINAMFMNDYFFSEDKIPETSQTEEVGE